MVRTRAQRGKGLVTPSPKIKSKIADECSPDDDTTPKARRGTEREKNLLLMKNKQLSTETPKDKHSKGKAKARRRSVSVGEEAEQVKAGEDETTDKRSVEQSPTKRSGRKKQKEKRTEIIEDSSIESVSIDSEGEIHYEDDDGIEEETANVDRKRVKRTMKIDDEDEEEEEDEEDDDEEEEEEEEEENEGEEEEDEEAEETREINSHLEAERLGDGEPEEDAEDSDAPEDVSFSRSRQEALDSISQALQQSRRSEEVAKAKRRKRDKLLKLQKEKKKISLQHSRLPDDFLAEIVDLPIQKEEVTVAPKTTSQSQPKKSGQHKMFDSDGEDNDENAMSGDDFIPFAPDEPCVVEGFEVHAISRQQKAPPPKSESALDFLQKQLYGSKIKRESVNKHRSRMMKRHGRPAMVFLNPKEKKRKLQD